MNKIIKWVKDCVNRFISTNEEEEEKEEIETKIPEELDYYNSDYNSEYSEDSDTDTEEEENTIVKGLGHVLHIKPYRCGCGYKGTKTGIRLHLEYN